MPLLAKTFEAIADDPHALYNGSLVDDVVADIREAGKIGCPHSVKNIFNSPFIDKEVYKLINFVLQVESLLSKTYRITWQ